MDGWNTIVSFWGLAYFQVRLLLVLGSVLNFVGHPPVPKTHFTFPCLRGQAGGFGSGFTGGCTGASGAVELSCLVVVVVFPGYLRDEISYPCLGL